MVFLIELRRRPLKWLLLIFLLTLFILHHRQPQTLVLLNPLTSWLVKAKSPYYSKNESRYYSWETKPFFPPLPTASNNRPSDFCASFPTYLLNSIQVVLKTGAGEPAKTKAHLTTITSCIANLIIFSDLDERVGNYHFIDILTDLPHSYAVNNSDFDIYTTQKHAHAQGDAKAYELHPDAKWFIFIKPDLDSTEMHYLGSPAPGSEGRMFAYGGAGFVLSQGLIKRLVGGQRIGESGQNVKNDYYRDAVLGYAILNKTGVKLEALYPTFTGDKINGLKEWERTRPFNKKPLVHSTLLAYTHSHLRDGPTREFWDNLSNIVLFNNSTAHSSASACSSACAADPKCLQYSYSARTCRFGDFIKLGSSVERSKGEFTSGWDTEKMEKLGFRNDGDTSYVCREATWLRPN
ncbi:glycosyltransferase family 31 protein [Zopfia rhizophila CBS 207.26]|uniref:Glycosyltransferase family 31 protein n=1 Tax=Zopfia rhizophila CBS 207.26 TaxID=1314779 RepID=A0A6A6DDP4_9PEZI|nr:glycosyltransferase family 31 protein [Zopfia rhizophila CBS 207.26]